MWFCFSKNSFRQKSNTPNTTSRPDLIKPYYNENTQNEIRILTSRLHQNEDNNKIYFTFSSFWEGGKSNLTTIREETEVFEHETIISDLPNVLDDFLLRFKRIFEHNPKHDRIRGHSFHGDDEVSKLSCFDGQNNEIPQTLLDIAFDYEGGIYSYDEDYNVYVIFQCHRANLYHGYDEPDVNKIPDKVKKHFNRG